MNLSVIVTCYNYADYVEEAVDSILGQQTRADEVIVVDDGSTDDSYEILESRYRNEGAMRIIRTPNGGQLAAFQTGIAAARGDVIAFLDADDRWRPGYLAAVTRKFVDAPDADIVIAQVRSFGKLEGRLWRSETRDRRIGYEVMRTAFQWQRNFVPTSGISLRASLARRSMNLPAEVSAEWKTRADDVLILGASLLGGCKHVIAEPLVEYRVHDANRWYPREASYLQQCSHLYRQNRLLRHFKRAGDVSRDMLRHAHLEFKSIERPVWKEFRAYLALSRQARIPRRAVAHQWMLMAVYVGRARQAARGQAYH
jgi:glycosyltransferase involved in cell wall biosynthesis